MRLPYLPDPKPDEPGLRGTEAEGLLPCWRKWFAVAGCLTSAIHNSSMAAQPCFCCKRSLLPAVSQYQKYHLICPLASPEHIHNNSRRYCDRARLRADQLNAAKEEVILDAFHL